MQPFDEDYMARRETQIKELYELRSATAACLITGAILGAIGLYAFRFGSVRLSYLLLGISGLFLVGTLFMIADYFGKQGADKAIRRERLEMYQMYGMEKPKRLIEMSDDGEIITEEAEVMKQSRNR